jgi:hypothetical protein
MSQAANQYTASKGKIFITFNPHHPYSQSKEPFTLRVDRLFHQWFRQGLRFDEYVPA